MTKSRYILILCSLFLLLQAHAQAPTRGQACPLAKVEVERLPDLNIPRSSHNTFCTNDEIVVVGGHTAGFVPTATAEYLKDGRWQQRTGCRRNAQQ